VLYLYIAICVSYYYSFYDYYGATATKTSRYICIIITKYYNYCYNDDKIKIITTLPQLDDVILYTRLLYYIVSIGITNSQEILIRAVVIHMHIPTYIPKDDIIKLKRKNITL